MLARNGKFEALKQSFTKLNKFSDEYEDLSITIFADAYPVEADKEGRIVLPADLVEHAGLGNQVSFMGVGDTFQIWEPAAGTRRRTEARAGSRIRELSLPAGAPLGASATNGAPA